MKNLTGSTATEIILAAELAEYDPPTFEPTIYDAFAMRSLGVDIDDCTDTRPCLAWRLVRRYSAHMQCSCS